MAYSDFGDFTNDLFLRIYKRRFRFRRFFIRDWWQLRKNQKAILKALHTGRTARKKGDQ